MQLVRNFEISGYQGHVRYLTYMLRSVHLGFNTLGIAVNVSGTVQIGSLIPCWHPRHCKMANLHASQAESVRYSIAVAHMWNFSDIRCLLDKMQLASSPVLACS